MPNSATPMTWWGATRAEAARRIVGGLLTPSLVGHRERVAEEVHEGRGGPAESRVLVGEAGRDDVALGEAGGGEEVLALQVVREGVLRVRPGWDALERVAAEAEMPREGSGPGGATPACGVGDDRLTDGCRCLGGGVPAAAAAEDLVRPDVQVVARRAGVLGPVVPEVDPEVGLVRGLV